MLTDEEINAAYYGTPKVTNLGPTIIDGLRVVAAVARAEALEEAAKMCDGLIETEKSLVSLTDSTSVRAAFIGAYHHAARLIRALAIKELTNG